MTHVAALEVEDVHCLGADLSGLAELDLPGGGERKGTDERPAQHVVDGDTGLDELRFGLRGVSGRNTSEFRGRASLQRRVRQLRHFRRARTRHGLHTAHRLLELGGDPDNLPDADRESDGSDPGSGAELLERLAVVLDRRVDSRAEILRDRGSLRHLRLVLTGLRGQFDADGTVGHQHLLRQSGSVPGMNPDTVTDSDLLGAIYEQLRVIKLALITLMVVALVWSIWFVVNREQQEAEDRVSARCVQTDC